VYISDRLSTSGLIDTPWLDKTIAKAFINADANRDGKLDKKEFERVMTFMISCKLRERKDTASELHHMNKDSKWFDSRWTINFCAPPICWS
jgi:hypothetical protein